MFLCTRCRGTGEITNDKNKTDACPRCARAAEAAWTASKTKGGKDGRHAA